MKQSDKTPFFEKEDGVFVPANYGFKIHLEQEKGNE